MKLDHQLVQHNQLSSEVFSNFKNFCFNIIIIFIIYFKFIEMSTLCRETVSQDPIPDVTSSPTNDDTVLETCDKIMNTDESYLSNLSVRN